MEAIIKRTRAMTEPFRNNTIPGRRGEECSNTEAGELDAIAVLDESAHSYLKNGAETRGADWLWEATSDPAFRLKY
jgi:hypothetical protein